jgi:signal transduction histidine kinase
MELYRRVRPILASVLRPPRHLLVAFIGLTLLPATALVWMGLWLTDQDRVLEQQRLKERQTQATNLIVTGLQQALSAAAQDLADPEKWPTLAVDDARVLIIDAQDIETFPATTRLAYLPFRKPLPEAPPEIFGGGERAEHQLQDHPAALAIYRELAKNPDVIVRMGALMRVARTLRNADRIAEALDVYGQAAHEDGVGFANHPVGLRARQARLGLLSMLNRSADLASEAKELQSDLLNGHWQLDRDSYDHHLEEVRQWMDGEAEVSETRQTEAEVLSRIVASVWSRWDSSESADFSDHQGFQFERGLGTIVWRETGDRLALLVAGPLYVERQWLAALSPLLTSQGVRLALQDAEAPPSSDQAANLRTAPSTGLPWSVLVAGDDADAGLAPSTRRQRFFIGGLVLLLIVVSGGSYFVARAVTRELAVARLQSDFVAAVSHEFRTPLTSLRQVTEILTDGRVDDGRRETYYQKQARATERLQRLVESLLDFGRMEAGKKPYVMERLEASSWLHSLVNDFQADVSADGYHIEFRPPEETLEIEADPMALTHALRNLLDNAVKYSPHSRTIWVELTQHKENVAIRVRDEGLGIPAHEQKQIFHKFVRGTGSKTNSIKGTGVGLSIVEHIVRAHGGVIELESEPGKGSTFTVRLPLAEAAVPHSA